MGSRPAPEASQDMAVPHLVTPFQDHGFSLEGTWMRTMHWQWHLIECCLTTPYIGLAHLITLMSNCHTWVAILDVQTGHAYHQHIACACNLWGAHSSYKLHLLHGPPQQTPVCASLPMHPFCRLWSCISNTWSSVSSKGKKSAVGLFCYQRLMAGI